MVKVFLSIFLFCFISPVLADYVTSTNGLANYNGFQSRLKMNQPTTTIATYNASRRSRYTPHCPGCHNHNYYNQYIPTSSLNALERYALKKNYSRENNLERLERLEELAFGSIQPGDYSTRFHNVEEAILSRPQQSYKKSLWGNLANYFVGQTTGFTPSLMPGFNPYTMSNSPINNNFITPPSSFFNSGGFDNGNYESYSNGIFGRGYGIRNNSFNSGSSVRLID